MAQSSIASYFNTRKRSAIEDLKLSRAKKVLVLDNASGNSSDVVDDKKLVFSTCIPQNETHTASNKTQEKEEKKSLIANRIVSLSVQKSTSNRINSAKKMKNDRTQQSIDDLFGRMSKSSTESTQKMIESTDAERQNCTTPPGTPTKQINAMDKVQEKPTGPSLKEIKRKMTRSAKLAELRASISRFQEGASKLKEIEKTTEKIEDSPKLKNFKTIELEIESSPQKFFSPEKSYLSPRKEVSTARKNLINLLSPTKNACAALPASPSKQILEETSRKGLTLPFKYRYLAEMFRSIDTICQMLFNRKEVITFRKVKPAVESMLKRNLSERHLEQIKHIYPNAFVFKQEKLKVFGTGMKSERWELVLTPIIEEDHITADTLLKRRRELFGILLNLTKDYHHEFLQSLDPPMEISKERITRWHPEFDIEKVPDIESALLPQPPQEEILTTGKDVLEKAKELFNCNTRMEMALQKLKEAQESKEPLHKEVTKEEQMPTSALKGIPKALLEKVRQKQAAKALLSMTRSADKEIQLQMYSRLPELAKLTRNLFVSEKKGVLPLEFVIEKLGNCYRTYLTRTDMESHLKLIEKEVPGWMVFHNIRNKEYVKLAKNADVSRVVNRLELLVKQINES